MAQLNSTAASLLGFLHAGEASGYELLNTAQLLIGDFWTMTRSQVYRELATLADRGLVEAGPAGPRSRRPYRITDEGRAAFAAWLSEPPGSEQIRYPLLLTLAFGSALDRDRLAEFIAEHRAVHEQRLTDYRERLAEGCPDRFVEATVVFGIRYEEGVLAWMDELPAILNGDRG